MWKSRIFFVGLVLVLASAQLWALPPSIVGADSRDALISGQIVEIRSLEDLVAYQESLIQEKEAIIAQKESEIELLQESLNTVKNESTGLTTDSTALLNQLEELKTQLETAKAESQMLQKLLNESKEELSALKAQLSEARAILEQEPDLLGGVFSAGVIYDTGFALSIDAGLIYDWIGLTVGIISDIDADFYLPSQWRYRAALQIYF